MTYILIKLENYKKYLLKKNYTCIQNDIYMTH